MTASSTRRIHAAHGAPLRRKRKTDLRRLGVAGIVFLVVSAAAPMTTAAVAVPTTIAVTGNIGMPLFYLIAGAVLLVFSVGFTRMTKHVHQGGAFFSYILSGLGRVPGAGAAVLALVAYYFLLVSLVVFLGVGTGYVIEAITGDEVPWGPLALVHVVLIGLLGYRNIDLSSRVLAILLSIEAVVVLGVNAVVAVAGGRDGITTAPFEPAVFSQGAAPVALMFAFLGFVGFEATAVFRQEAKRPERTIPRATYLAVVIIAVFYALTSWMIIVAAGADEVVASAAQDPSTLFIRIAGEYVSPALVDLIQLLLITSVFAAALSFHNVIGRYQFALAQSRMFPKFFAVLNPRHDSPSNASLATTIITGVLVGIASFTGLDPLLQINAWLSGAATLGIVALMALTSIAVIVFFRRTRLDRGVWSTIVAPAVSAAALTAVAALVVGNFVLIVGDPVVAAALEGVLALAFVVGMLIALRTRARRPDVYALLKPPHPRRDAIRVDR